MFLSDYVLDNGLKVFNAEANRIDICHTLPSSFTEATVTFSVGNKNSVTVGSPVAAAPNGRKVIVSAVQDGNVTHTSQSTADDAQYWAITDATNSRLLAAGVLGAAQMVTSGNTFNLSSFEFGIPNQ